MHDTKQHATKQVATRYAHVRESLHERARRLFVASEAVAQGYGGIALVARATGVARRTIGVGIAELQDRKSTRLNSSHIQKSRMPSSA